MVSGCESMRYPDMLRRVFDVVIMVRFYIVLATTVGNVACVVVS